MSGWYELSKSDNGQYRFKLVAGNGEPILSSEQYTTLAAAKNGIESVQKNCLDAARFSKETATNGKAYFNLKAANHQIIGTSQMYASEASRDNGIESVMKNGGTDKIKDLTA
ncbi:YegP family protein [Hydromonas duriensis]|uniref:DUF1508 domain-containing protein n=1 Tax=Hydromonas duriensis TaxID=1527608 RepID=A0A4R6Y476_9BURK|nr:YegP family protein [Hydromonas duriensis]TDR28839.1 hypothetical protein DFR44_13310 [Hydromonas duriensis]